MSNVTIADWGTTNHQSAIAMGSVFNGQSAVANAVSGFERLKVRSVFQLDFSGRVGPHHFYRT
jgi:hypothetical protein